MVAAAWGWERLTLKVLRQQLLSAAWQSPSRGAQAGTSTGARVSSGIPGEVQGPWTLPPLAMHTQTEGPLPSPTTLGVPPAETRSQDSGGWSPVAASLLCGSLQLCRPEKPTPAPIPGKRP